MYKKRGILFFSIFLQLIILNFVYAVDFEFNGTVYDVNGNPLNNTIINITIRDTTWNIVGYNSTVSNESGWFNLSVDGNQNFFYQPVLQHFNDSYIDYVGQSLPAFPYQEFFRVTDVNFYLKNAGTINVTAVNSTGDRISFNYMVKDTKLGYNIGGDWSNYVEEIIVYVPTDRNYSIMIYPQNSLPVSYDISNITSYENNTIVKEFNTSMTLARIYGYINVTGIDGWDEFTVIPYLLEPGNMIFMKQGNLPYNISSWATDNLGIPLNETDYYTLSSGFYNITLPAPAESATLILFATARNDTGYYGGFRNVSLTYGDADIELNFTSMAGLLGNDWASANSNISMKDAQAWSSLNISTTKQQFNLVNSTNDTLSQTAAHIEITVDYSNYEAIEFTFMEDIEQTASASFYIPLLNGTGIKEMNIFSQMYAPRRLSLTASQIQDSNNLTLLAFNPGEIDAAEDALLAESDVSVAFYLSNSSCDLPTPGAGCVIGNLDMSNFNPLSAIIGGGAISFRMGYGNILVHYVNVDMLASGPPDAAFDDSTASATSGDSFGAALRFGSKGPTVYDYVIVSMPYTETASSGLEESQGVNMSIPVLYDDDWNVIWNITENGTSGSSLAGNESHYSTYQNDWETLMGNNTCVTDANTFNVTNPCYIDTTNNKIWIRLPHFSGTGPSVTGTTKASSSTSTSSGSTGGGTGGAAVSTSINIEQGTTQTLSLGEIVSFTIAEKTHTLKISQLSGDSVTLRIESSPIIITLKTGETKKLDINDDGALDLMIKVEKIADGKVDLFIKKISEKELTLEEKQQQQLAKEQEEQKQEKKERSLWPLISVALIIILIIVYSVFLQKRKRSR